MDWQNQRITRYLTVCEHDQNGLWTSVQRFSPYSDLRFRDEEVITIDLFGIIDKQRDIKRIYTQAKRYWHDWFPSLPSYTAYLQRLNRLAACFPALSESFCPTQTSTSLVGLVDSFPIVMAQRSRRYRAKVAPEYASCGYCASKQRHYYSVKLHLIGDRRAGTMPMPRYAGLTDAATHDASAFEQVMYLTYPIVNSTQIRLMNIFPAILTCLLRYFRLLKSKKGRRFTMRLTIGFLVLSPPFDNPLNRFLTGLSKKQGFNVRVKCVLPMGFCCMSSADSLPLCLC